MPTRCHETVRPRFFHIYRYDPDADDKPRMQVIELAVGASDRMLLDVLTRLKAIDPSLSLRRSCREGIYGSDAMKINGINGMSGRGYRGQLRITEIRSDAHRGRAAGKQ